MRWSNKRVINTDGKLSNYAYYFRTRKNQVRTHSFQVSVLSPSLWQQVHRHPRSQPGFAPRTSRLRTADQTAMRFAPAAHPHWPPDPPMPPRAERDGSLATGRQRTLAVATQRRWWLVMVLSHWLAWARLRELSTNKIMSFVVGNNYHTKQDFLRQNQISC